MENTSKVGLLIIIINLIVTYYGFKNPVFFEKFKFNIAGLKKKEYIRLLSSGFLHVDWSHFFFNMLSLYFFSYSIEVTFGGLGFIIIYLFSLIGGNLIAWSFHNKQSWYSAVGASGAVSGMIFAFIMCYPNMGMYLFFIPIPIPAWIYGILFVGISIFGMSKNRDNIGHEAHLGGAINGMLLAIILIPEFAIKNYWVLFVVLIPAIILLVILYLKNNKNLKAFSSTKLNSKGLSLDDQYNLSKKNREIELNALLEKIRKHGYESLTSAEKQRLDELSKD